MMDDLGAKWKQAVEGMTFFGEPVKDLSRERLLMLVGMLMGKPPDTEVERLRREVDLLKSKIAAMETPKPQYWPNVSPWRPTW